MLEDDVDGDEGFIETIPALSSFMIQQKVHLTLPIVPTSFSQDSSDGKSQEPTQNMASEKPRDSDMFAAMHEAFSRKLSAGEALHDILPTLVYSANVSRRPSSGSSVKARQGHTKKHGDHLVHKTRDPFEYTFKWNQFASTATKCKAEQEDRGEVTSNRSPPLVNGKLRSHRHGHTGKVEVSEARGSRETHENVFSGGGAGWKEKDRAHAATERKLKATRAKRERVTSAYLFADGSVCNTLCSTLSLDDNKGTINDHSRDDRLCSGPKISATLQGIANMPPLKAQQPPDTPRLQQQRCSLLINVGLWNDRYSVARLRSFSPTSPLHKRLLGLRTSADPLLHPKSRTRESVEEQAVYGNEEHDKGQRTALGDVGGRGGGGGGGGGVMRISAAHAVRESLVCMSLAHTVRQTMYTHTCVDTSKCTHVSTHVRALLYTHVRVDVCERVYTCAREHLHTYTHKHAFHACTFSRLARTRKYLYTRTCKHLYTSTREHSYTCTCKHLYIHTHEHS